VARRPVLLNLQALVVLVAVSCGQPSASSQTPTATQPTPTPSASPTMTSADMAQLVQLEARPLKLPALRPGAACPPDGTNASTGLFGNGPVYAQGGPHTANAYGDYYDVSAMTPPGIRGPILARGRDLKVSNHPIVFLGPYAVGNVYGTDPDLGAQYLYLALDTAHPPVNAPYPINGTDYVQWFWRQGIAKGWTGCVGFQFDGPTFTEVFIANVVTRTP
jgi:hypothetical protein